MNKKKQAHYDEACSTVHYKQSVSLSFEGTYSMSIEKKHSHSKKHKTDGK